MEIKYSIPRDTIGIECPNCHGYAKRVNCTTEENKQYGCGSRFECCSRAFVCVLCNSRFVGTAESPEME